MAHLLVVDDEAPLREAIVMVLRAAGHTVSAVESGEAAIAAATATPFDALVVDITLPGLSGIDVVKQLKQTSPELPAVFITAHSSIPSAVEAMRVGGFDYLPKPFDNDELVLKVERALQHAQLRHRVRTLEHDLQTRTTFVGIVGRSAAVQQMTRALAKVARTNAPVLLLGESGTGKELAARTLHRHSDRVSGPFVAVNCGAITASLAESEFFGHERGAFTDARAEHRGIFERAQHGTVFLDEVGELPPDLQVKLLRVLQEGEVVRVGGSRSIPVNARVIAATNRDLSAEVRNGRFREDLYWRLNVVSIAMPPLRERRDDLPMLVDHLLELVNAECGTRILRVSAAAMTVFAAHEWPGNVRELLNALRRGAVMADGDEIDVVHLPDQFRRGLIPLAEASTMGLHGAVLEIERSAIEAALARAGGNRERAAEALGISRRTLFNKLKQTRKQPTP